MWTAGCEVSAPSTILEHVFETSEPLTVQQLYEFAEAVRRLDDSVDDAERLEQIRELEQLKAAAVATQARVAASLAASQWAEPGPACAPPVSIAELRFKALLLAA